MAQDTTFRNVVDGRLVDAVAGETYDVVDPSTGQAYGRAPMSRAEDVDRAYAAADRAFEAWGQTTPQERSLALLRIADAIDARADEITRVECRDTGKPIGLTASEELPPSSDHFRFFAGAARVLEGRSAGEYLAGHTSFIRREPIGVVAQVTPWNYPMMMAVWKWAPAIGVSVPASSRARALRVRRASCGSTSPMPAHSSSTNSSGQCTTSPSISTRSVPDDTTMIVLPGVCPGATIVSTPGSSGPEESQNSMRSVRGASLRAERSSVPVK